MTKEKMAEMFHGNDDEYLKFDRITSLRSKRPDLHAFMLLDELVPGDSDIVSGAHHDEIYLQTDCDKLAAAASEDQITELIRCGVSYNSDYDCLSMFT